MTTYKYATSLNEKLNQMIIDMSDNADANDIRADFNFIITDILTKKQKKEILNRLKIDNESQYYASLEYLEIEDNENLTN